MDIKTKESFVMYDSFLQAAEFLPADNFKEFILKLRDYALYGNEEPSENAMIDALLTMAKPNLRAAEERRLKQIENGNKGKEFGKLGGAPRKGETREEYDARRLARTQDPLNNPQEPLKGDTVQPLNVNVNGNEDVNEKVNENEKDNGNGKVNVSIEPPSNPSPSPSFPSSFNSPSCLSNSTIDNKEKTQDNPSLTETITKKEEKKIDSHEAVEHFADGSIGMSQSEYLKELFVKYMRILIEYRLKNLDFDEKSKDAHNNATHAVMRLYDYSYERAKDFVNDILKEEVEEAKSASL